MYFADKASYSESFGHTLPYGMKQMFLAEVVLGDHIELPENIITEPPLKDDYKTHYDSVKGHTNGSDVYMVYANEKCYPRYLVTFQ